MGEAVWTQLLGGLRGLFEWLYDLVCSLGLPILEGFRDALAAAWPGAATINLSPLVPWLEMVNAWFPLDLAGLLLAAWLAFECSVVGFRMLLRFLPGF